MNIDGKISPVVLFTYNRLECTKKALEALEKNSLANKSTLYIFSDGPKGLEDIAVVRELRMYLDEYCQKSVFKEIYLRKADKNRGLANSVISGVSEIISKYGSVIVLEDDCITTTDFLIYMNTALKYFEKNQSIWSVTGYTFLLPALSSYKHDVYLSYRASSLGWGTWKDRWETVDWQVTDYRLFRRNIAKRKKFIRGGNDLPSMLKAQINGKIDSWAVRWCYSQSMQDKFTVYPRKSRLYNIGFDEGVHSTPKLAKRYTTILSDREEECKFENILPEKQLIQEMYDMWSLSISDRIFGFFELEIKTIKKKIRMKKGSQ